MTDVQKEVIGYFAWERTSKEPTPVKYHVWRKSQQAETAKHYEGITLGEPVPLDVIEWNMSLDRLAIKYPCPVREDKAAQGGETM